MQCSVSALASGRSISYALGGQSFWRPEICYLTKPDLVIETVTCGKVTLSVYRKLYDANQQ